ncbi:MAG: hypothetical protein ACYSW8_31140 [Planctomycetota bacterium]|jgi:hypothetical protein
MFGVWPSLPSFGDDVVLGPKPVYWWGTSDRDGDVWPWNAAPAGSVYLYMSGATPTLYIKDVAADASAGNDTDWGEITIT